MSDPKLVVFISSTSKDLPDHRLAAARAARQAGFEYEMMEEFPSQTRLRPDPACMEKVRACDVLIVLVAHRYGWVPPDQPGNHAKSITWLECEEILRGDKKEILAFVIDPDYTWPAELKEEYRVTKALLDGNLTKDKIDEISRNVKNLVKFKSWLDSLGFRRTFTDPASVNSQVQESLTKWLHRQPPKIQAAAESAKLDDPTEYLRQLQEETGWIDIRGLQVGSGKANRFPIDDLYVPLTIPGAERGPVSLEDALTHQHLLIEGDPGAGKTTFLLRIANHLCRDHPTRGFPIFIRIGDLEKHIATCLPKQQDDALSTEHSPRWLLHYLTTQSRAKNWNLNEAFFATRLKDPATTILLDGLDEATSSRARESLARLLHEAVQANPNCRFVVTTRPQSYTGKSRLAGFHEVRVDDLQPDAIAAFLGHWSRALFPGNTAGAQTHQEALSLALSARPAIRRMARNPVMLTALAVVHWNERRLPEQRADLYDSIATWLARAREDKPEREKTDRVLSLLAHLALGMQTRPKGRVTQIGKDTAAGIIAPQFRELPTSQERRERARAFLEAEEIDSGIFVSRGGDLKFWHLTLQEFLAARAIAGLTEVPQSKLLFEKDHLYQPEWREVLLLLAGTLIKRGSDRLDALFGEMLQRTGAQSTLAEKARCVGLLGAMLADLQPHSYHLPDNRYEQMLHQVLGIFDREKSKGIDLQIRLDAAEALGQAGDPRLKLPHEMEYWASILGGKFLMGDNQLNDAPKREVALKPYLIGRFPVTVFEYGKFLEYTEYESPLRWEEQSAHPNRPVVEVTWHDAQAYCDWAKVRLPMEAEWERAARGIDCRPFPWGKEPPNPLLANYNEVNIGSPSPVGLFPRGSTPPPEEIADLAGNVWEWCQDWYNSSKAHKVLRGGSWYYYSAFLHAANRSTHPPGGRSDDIGFRCARDPFP